MKLEPTLTKAGQRVLTLESRHSAIKEISLPFLHVDAQLERRIIRLGTLLDGNSTTLQSRTTTIFSFLVAIIKLSKQSQSWFYLQVSLAEHLEMTYVKYRVGT